MAIHSTDVGDLPPSTRSEIGIWCPSDGKGHRSRAERFHPYTRKARHTRARQGHDSASDSSDDSSDELQANPQSSVSPQPPALQSNENVMTTRDVQANAPCLNPRKRRASDEVQLTEDSSPKKVCLSRPPSDDDERRMERSPQRQDELTAVLNSLIATNAELPQVIPSSPSSEQAGDSENQAWLSPPSFSPKAPSQTRDDTETAPENTQSFSPRNSESVASEKLQQDGPIEVDGQYYVSKALYDQLLYEKQELQAKYDRLSNAHIGLAFKMTTITHADVRRRELGGPDDAELGADLLTLEDGLYDWAREHETSTTRQNLSKRLKREGVHPKRAEEWAKFASLDKKNIPLFLDSEQLDGNIADFVTAWLWEDVSELFRAPLSILDGFAAPVTDRRAQQSQNFGHTMVEFEQRLRACYGDSENMLSYTRNILRMLYPNFSRRAPEPTLDLEALKLLNDGFVSKFAEARATAFVGRASPFLNTRSLKKRTAAIRDLTKVFTTAVATVLKVSTQRQDFDSTAASAGWLRTPFDPAHQEYSLHRHHDTGSPDYASAFDGSDILLISRPKFVMRRDNKGDSRDTCMRTVSKGVVLVEPAH